MIVGEHAEHVTILLNVLVFSVGLYKCRGDP